MAKPYRPSASEYLNSPIPGSEHLGFRKALKIIGGLIVFGLVLAISFVIYLLIRLGVNPLEFGSLRGDSNGRVNILVLGVGDPGHAGQNLSDTNMVISLDNSTKSAALLSVPRDLRVPIPGYYETKINAANALGGPVLAEQTMSNALNQPMNYYVVANFSALKQIVDTIGGLDVTVTDRLYDPEFPCDANQYASCGLDIKPGQYRMNGTTVLNYTRCRKGTCGNDFGRAQRQQQIIGLIKQKLTSPSIYLNPVKLNQLVTIERANVTTDMSTMNLIELALALKNSQHTINAVLSTSPGGMLGGINGSSDLTPIGGFSQIQDYAKNIFTAPPLPAPNQ